MSLSGSIKVDVWNGSDALLNQRIVKLTPNDNIDDRWFYWQITNIILEIERMGKWALVNNVSITDLKDLQIPLPPLPVQKRIAEILDAADALRRKDQELLNKYDELAQAIFIDMFGDPVKNEKGWEVKRLGECCDVRDGTHDSPKYVNQGYPLVTSKNLRNGIVDLSETNLISELDYININKRSKVNIGDILMPMIGTIGNPVIVDFLTEFAIKNVCLIKPGENLRAEYIKYQLKSSLMEDIIDKSSRGGTQKFLSLTDIRNITIHVPPERIQEDFASKLILITKMIASCKFNLSHLLFDSLILKAFKGELC